MKDGNLSSKTSNEMEIYNRYICILSKVKNMYENSVSIDRCY